MRAPAKLGPDPTPALVARLRALLKNAETLDEVLHVRGIASGAEKFFKAAQHSRHMAQEAAEVRLRAERRAGEMLIDMERKGERDSGRGGDRKSQLQPATVKLPDLGVEKTQSHRWQQIARVPGPLFESYIERGVEEEHDELTTAGLLRVLKEQHREKKRAHNRRIVEDTEYAESLVGESYPTIVIDPPWDWGDEGDVDQFGRGRPEYATMPVEEIAALPVEELADDDAHLYLWITNRSLPKGFDLLDAWGFRYVTALTWCKPSIGMGNYFRGSTEHVLFGVRGSLDLLVRDAGTWFAAKRTSEHSGKPAEFYQLVERCSPGPWLEMFARGPRKGWKVWGAESDGGAT
jgi:N6-adenosine-specific RNA methylase IME4